MALSGAAPAVPDDESRVWVHDVPEASDDPRAVLRRERELARPVRGRPGVRAVCLRYRDGVVDLVLTARRSVPPTELHRLAAALLDGAADRVTPSPTAVGDSWPAGAAPDWGGGEEGAPAAVVDGRVVLQGPAGSSRTWATALRHLLARYDEHRPTAFVVLDDAVTVHGDGPVVAGLAVDPPAPPAGAAGAAGGYRPWLTPPWPLCLHVSSSGDHSADGRAVLGWQARVREVAPATAERFAHHLALVHEHVLGGGDPDELELPVPVAGRAAAPASRSPHRLDQLFAAQAARSPDAVAVTDGDLHVSYRELDRRADRLARGLRASGVGEGDAVGVLLERSVELVVVLIAVLKAGAVYVPMDPGHPPERLSFTAADAGVRLVVTTTACEPRTPTVTPAELSARGGPDDGGPPTSSTGPEDPAYVIYTSGSSGRPKGCVVPHANVVGLLDATREDLALSAADVWSLFHSVAFDFSVWELWACLLTGARLVIVPLWVARSPEEFRALLAAEGVTVLNQTPSAFTQLIAADAEHRGPLDVRLVVLGGETLDARILLPWFDRHPERDCRVVNMFGITETTVHVTSGTVTRAAALRGSRSVGRPLPGWSVSVRDSRGRVVPPGVAGELHVGGVGLAIGYLDRPELTALRFVRDGVTGERRYRSGDLGRMLADGTVEHLGRLDDQVKVRGFRIELGEIRAVLLELPDVTAAAVVPRRDDAGDVRLDAYAVTPSELEGETVRRRLRDLLPDYMVPATVTRVAALPLTANGKLDVAALPPPARPAPGVAIGPDAGAGPGADADDRERDDPVRRALVEVWTEVLGTSVGPDDDFFALGGNSLKAVRISAAMRARGLTSVPPRTLYLNPTVGRLVRALRPAPGRGPAPPPDPVPRSARSTA